MQAKEVLKYRTPKITVIPSITVVVLESHIYFQQKNYTTRIALIQAMVTITYQSCPSENNKVSKPQLDLLYDIEQCTTIPLPSPFTWK